MKDKIFEPARHNEKAPAEGMAAVNTHMPEEAPIEKLIEEQRQQIPGAEQQNDQTMEQFEDKPGRE